MNKQVLIGLISVFLGLVAGAILMAFTGNNPFLGFTYLFRGGLMNIGRIGDTLSTATTLILTGLSVAFAFRTGLFNIGASGQMLFGGLCATAVGLSLDAPRAIVLIVAVLAAFIGGGLWALVPGLLKARFNVHEVVSTIMMNWIAYWTIYYTVPAFFKGAYDTESRAISKAASLRSPWLTDLFNDSSINLGLFLALIAVIAIAVILNRTVLGFELKAAGYNRFSAEYAGMKVNRNIVLSMVIAGALAGLAGATFYIGYANTMKIGVLPSYGFDGIAVALLGANSPYGVLVSAIFFGILHSGKGFMNAMTSIPPEIGDTIIATIIYFAATSVLIERAIDSIRKKIKGGK
ncbi:MAG: ABC transporter permease [Spirochaetales bacterium]|nr:ABC transporter permease [Spirochaetales bacterium]